MPSLSSKIQGTRKTQCVDWMAQEFAVNECESRCLAVSHGTVGEGATAEEVAVSEAVVGAEGEGRVPAAVTAVLGRDP